MTAELLRRAAKEMRERAETATPGPWESFCPGSEGFDVREKTATDYRSRPRTIAKIRHGGFEACRRDAEYLASWPPGVALAVADLLDEEARGEENGLFDASFLALAVARAYLGETAA